MKQITNRSILLLAILLIGSTALMAQANNEQKTSNSPTLKTYLIEREIPGAGKLTSEDLKAISQTSCTVLKGMGDKIQWLHSYVTGNKIFCVYKAENEALIREHAKKGGFPANIITEITTVISPDTAN